MSSSSSHRDVATSSSSTSTSTSTSTRSSLLLLQPATTTTTTPESSTTTPTTNIMTSSIAKGKQRMVDDSDSGSDSGLANKTTKVVITPPKGWLHFVAGGVGGMCGAIITSPLDVVKTRLQSDLFKQKLLKSETSSASASTSRSGILATSRRLAWHFVETANLLGEISSKEGTRALFKGLGPTLVGVVPARSINFYTYGNGKIILADRFNEGKQNAGIHLIAAAFAGIVTATATNPIWVVKTRLQLDSHAIEAAASDRRKASIGKISSSTSTSTTSTSSSTSSSAAFRPSAQVQAQSQTIATSTTLKSNPTSTSKSTFFKPKPSPQAPALNSIKTAAFILRTEGIRGLYKGLSASYLGVAEGTIQWVLYERLKKFGIEEGGKGEIKRGGFREWMGTVGAAGIAKAVASLITYPHEVVRTRLRQQPAAGQSPRYTGLLQTIKLVLREEGAPALYGGLSAHLLRVVPNAVVMFSIYELALRLGAGPAVEIADSNPSSSSSDPKETERLV